MTTEIRRGSARFLTREAGRQTRHAFSFGAHYDPERLGFGALVCHDEHLLAAGQGFEAHRHAGVVIVSWVLDGVLEHRHDGGDAVALPAGSLGVLRPGDGTEHSEVGRTGTRFVQLWLSDAEERTGVSHEVVELAPALDAARGTWVEAPDLGLPGVTLRLIRIGAQDVVTLPTGPRVYATLTRGALLRFSLAEPLQAGDSILLVDEPAHEVQAAVDTELLVLTLP